MKIAIVGHGNVGGALAMAWAKAGHDIVIGTRKADDEKAAQLVTSHEQILEATLDEAVREAAVILVATPAPVTADLAKAWGALPGKVIIDATNALWQQPDPYETGYHAFAALSDTDVVKAFNTTGFENMADPVYGDTTADMFMAGDSAKAKTIATQLSKDAGFENCYDFGDSNQVQLLEKFALAWINLAIFQKMGRNIGFKLVTR